MSESSPPPALFVFSAGASPLSPPPMSDFASRDLFHLRWVAEYAVYFVLKARSRPLHLPFTALCA